MDVKNGRYAIYNSKEYEADKANSDYNDAKIMILISYEAVDQKNDFIEVSPNRYVKRVSFSEIETAYSINTKGTYKRLPITILEQFGDQYKIHHVENGLAAEKLGFIKIEPGWFEKVVPIHDVENIYEKKTPLWGFK
ncbi:hypothetical protein ACSVDE_17235 [Pseudalkalibacillus sp. Hm43]|uniref:hypothetical protein n=1 Tax=Pseudalkalibacillus sp. Hm43 TaxID=3450742 RepID=UPI003F4268A7